MFNIVIERSMLTMVPRFYHTDNREPDGTPRYYNPSPEAHGEHYLRLAEEKEQGPWNNTFVDGKGYVKFDESLIFGGHFPLPS